MRRVIAYVITYTTLNHEVREEQMITAILLLCALVAIIAFIPLDM